MKADYTRGKKHTKSYIIHTYIDISFLYILHKYFLYNKIMIEKRFKIFLSRTVAIWLYCFNFSLLNWTSSIKILVYYVHVLLILSTCIPIWVSTEPTKNKFIMPECPGEKALLRKAGNHNHRKAKFTNK